MTNIANSLRSSSTRVRSIDIMRAVTMLVMIFVNDFWTLNEVPEWLKHMPAQHDGMGLSDVVFPAFLFIVGLSIPHAIRARQKKGDNKLQLIRHIGERTFALILMGVFMVNSESFGQDLLLGPLWWKLLMVLAFFLIWNIYRGKVGGVIPPLAFKILGWAILALLAITYSGTDGQWMKTHWWGILGLIGWGYLLSALVYLLLGQRPGWIALVLLTLLLLNVNEFFPPFESSIRLVVGASNYALVLSGVLVTSLVLKYREKGKRLFPMLIGLAVVLFVFGTLSRPLWGISKILATPSWTAICAAISILSFVLLYVIADILGHYRWATPIAAAGSLTLTCYLMPYYFYSFRSLLGIELPDALTTGPVGLLKSLLFALLVIQTTGLIGRLGVKLKI